MTDYSDKDDVKNRPSVMVSLDPAQEADAYGFFELLKPRVMSLVIFTAFVGMLAAPGQIHPFLALAAIAMIAIGAGASGALNMWFDADIDADMDRTKKRPVPSGRIKKGEALGFGLALSVFSVVFLGLIANVTAAVLLGVTIFFYVVVYSIWLKRRTPQNIVIGGAAGAFPPMIGWAVVSDSVTLESFILFLIIFLWTPPHFWALSLLSKVQADYGRVGVPMLPLTNGEMATRRQILAYSLLLPAVAFSPYWLGFAGRIYAGASLLLSALFLLLAYRVFRADESAPKQLFFFSIFYLFSHFAILAIEHAVGF